MGLGGACSSLRRGEYSDREPEKLFRLRLSRPFSKSAILDVPCGFSRVSNALFALSSLASVEVLSNFSRSKLLSLFVLLTETPDLLHAFLNEIPFFLQ